MIIFQANGNIYGESKLDTHKQDEPHEEPGVILAEDLGVDMEVKDANSMFLNYYLQCISRLFLTSDLPLYIARIDKLMLLCIKDCFCFSIYNHLLLYRCC